MFENKTYGLEQNMRRYEDTAKSRLLEHVPVVIRVDGRAFKNYTKGFVTPFDTVFRTAMRNTMIALCANVPNCVLGYTFSDEISLILVQKTYHTAPWFDNEVEKLVSNVASMTTLFFNREFAKAVSDAPAAGLKRYEDKLWRATFDARAFNLPESQVELYLYWRQMDCIRNAISQAARALPGMNHSVMKGQDLAALKMMLAGGGTPWESFSNYDRFGTFATKQKETFERVENGSVVKFARDKWAFREESPELSKDRDFLNEIAALVKPNYEVKI